VPIVLNPILALPFLVAPIVCTFVTYFAFVSGIVPGMGYPLAAVWTVPSIFSAVIATTSIRSAVLVVVNFVIYFVIYYPFFKTFEKKQLLEEGSV
jgi:PTS system cellobiose-specific IIC component